MCERLSPPTFDLTESIFKPYNSLLDSITGTGDPRTDYAAPDLSGNPGANLTGITRQVPHPHSTGYQRMHAVR